MENSHNKTELLDKTLQRMQLFYESNRTKKPIKRIFDENIDVIIYRRLLVQRYFDTIEVFDNSTNIYRPLPLEELIKLDSMDIDEFCDDLLVSNSIERIKNNRNAMHLGIAKGNQKEKDYHYKIAKNAIKNLKDFLRINKK